MRRAQELIVAYGLHQHPEGGWFAEDYTCPWDKDGRPLAGSIFFLLDGEEVSHFHQIDCDELWYYHEGGGLKITMLLQGELRTMLLGRDQAAGERACVLLPAGAVFAAENLDKTGYTFLSCATAPAFRYEGFRLISAEELEKLIPREAAGLRRLAIK